MTDPTATDFLNGPSHSTLHRKFASSVRTLAFTVPFDASGLSTGTAGHTLITPGTDPFTDALLVNDLILDITVAVNIAFDGATPIFDLSPAPANGYGYFQYLPSSPTTVSVVNVGVVGSTQTAIGNSDQSGLPSLDWALNTANYNERFLVAATDLVCWVTTDGSPPNGGANDPANGAGSLDVFLWVSTPTYIANP